MPDRLLDAAVLDKLEQLGLRQKSRSGKPGNRNLSRTPSGACEFFDHRRYQLGDDLRRLNWQAYLRSEALVVKLYQDDLLTPTRLLLDCSSSMTSGSRVGGETKFNYAKRLAAALLYIGLVRLESTVVQPFSFQLARAMRYQGGRQNFAIGQRHLQELRAGGRTDYKKIAAEYLHRYPISGLTIVISDFLGDGECLRALQSIFDHGHELRLIQLWAPEDRDPVAASHLTLVDAESYATLSVSTDDKTLLLYRQAFDRHSEALRAMAMSSGGGHLALSSETPLLRAMFGPMVESGMVG